MSNNYHFTLCVLLMILVGCVAVESQGATPMRGVARGVFSGIGEARQEIIKDQRAWQQFWARHSVQVKSAGKLPEIDFTNDMVIAVTMGRQRTGGFTIEIDNVEVVDQKLKVSIKRTAPQPGAMSIQVLTAPFHFVAVPKSDLKPEFVEVKAEAKK